MFSIKINFEVHYSRNWIICFFKFSTVFFSLPILVGVSIIVIVKTIDGWWPLIIHWSLKKREKVESSITKLNEAVNSNVVFAKNNPTSVFATQFWAEIYLKQQKKGRTNLTTLSFGIADLFQDDKSFCCLVEFQFPLIFS